MVVDANMAIIAFTTLYIIINFFASPAALEGMPFEVADNLSHTGCAFVYWTYLGALRWADFI